jgi:hypothetical protein
MKIVLLITVIESFVVALLLILWRFKSAYSIMPARVSARSAISDGVNLPTITTRRRALDESRWTFINRWQVEPQSDDRIPVVGDVAHSAAAPSPRRSTARRMHQAMYKEWSKGRHD